MNKKVKVTLLVLTAIPLLVCGCNKNKENSENETSSVNSSTESTMGEMNNSSSSDATDKTSELIANDDTTEGDIGVNYIESDELVQKEYYASADDINLNRPSTLTGSEVFVGWVEQDVVSQIGNGALEENESISLTVEAVDISDTENAIYNDTVYVSTESEYIEIPITIGGNANFSILDLEVSFDTEMFTFDSFTYADDDALCNYDEGKILISFVSTSNIKSDVNLCTLKLKKNTAQSSDAKLDYVVKDIAAWNNASTGYIEVSHTIVNDKIVMY